MIITSPVFLFLFFPLFLLFYYVLPAKIKNAFLLLSSLIFYAWGEKRLVLLLIISAICNYIIGRFIERFNKKTWLVLSLIFNLTILFYFKYLHFTFDNIRSLLSIAGINPGNFLPSLSIIVPLGISFLTFRAISYSLDVYKAKVPASHNLISFLTYFTMFPPIIAGPIVRYSEISVQLDSRRISLEDVSAGIERFTVGLFKKVIIANTFGLVADQVFLIPVAQLPAYWAWIGLITFFFQIYYDFSGYSDMAIGLARMIGFRFNENFNYPYIAKDIRDFWRRWHISLTTWLRDYIFLPLAFSLSKRWKKDRIACFRTDRLIHIIAVMITFIACGFWHGPTWGYIFWGIFYGFFIVIESAGFGKILKKAWKPLQHIYTLLIVIIGWVFFKNEHLSDAFRYLGKMFSFSRGDSTISSYLSFYYLTKEFLFVSLIALFFITPLYPKISRAINSGWPDKKIINKTIQLGSILTLLFLLLISVAYIAAGTHNPFIYSKF